MVAGNQPRIPDSILEGVRTLTANIVLEMGYAADLHREALIATAVVLFVFILSLSICCSLCSKGGKRNDNDAKQPGACAKQSACKENTEGAGHGHATAFCLRWLVRLCMMITVAVLLFLVGYILIRGVPHPTPSLFAWEYNSENVSMMPAIINTITDDAALSAHCRASLGIFAAIQSGGVCQERAASLWGFRARHRRNALLASLPLYTACLACCCFVTALHNGSCSLSGRRLRRLAIMISARHHAHHGGGPEGCAGILPGGQLRAGSRADCALCLASCCLQRGARHTGRRHPLHRTHCRRDS